MSLFPDVPEPERPDQESLGPGAWLLRGFARPVAEAAWDAVAAVLKQAPVRHRVTPGGFRMSVAMSNCGPLGWVSDRTGYRYTQAEPESGRPWPAMPTPLRTLATQAAARGGFSAFAPDACLINRYEPGARLTLHQDRNERDFRQPIVSVSLGLPAVFLWGGSKRSDRTVRVPLCHGDVVVWGGPARLRYHGVSALKNGEHPLTGCCRVNLTFRQAG